MANFLDITPLPHTVIVLVKNAEGIDRQMWLCGASCFDDLFQFRFTRLKCQIAQLSLKQFVP
jgi:hypothetical protein